MKPIQKMKVEAHRRYVDIQSPISGEETYGVGRLTEENLAKPYDEAKDLAFYDQPMRTVTLKPGEFAMFKPPYGAHGPSCTKGMPAKLKKVVIKVRIDE